ncbi:hypothetical protein M422DRAFT_44130 [Sphaerobolus stellatus SS14]|nr:hypothetical protein M422DRAFT_44130 [Sphaerobolus stellatus SS14]
MGSDNDVNSILRRSLKEETRLTRDVAEMICRFTTDLENRKAVERILSRRLDCPSTVGLNEVDNTLVILYWGLYDYSVGDTFRIYCLSQKEKLKRLSQGSFPWRPNNDQVISNIQSIAGTVVGILDSNQPRSSSSGRTVDSSSPPQTPLRTPEPRLAGIDNALIASPRPSPRALRPSPGISSRLLTIPINEEGRLSPKSQTIIRDPILDVTERVRVRDDTPKVSEFSYVYTGDFFTNKGTEKVAIKFLNKRSEVDSERLSKHLRREIRAWMKLKNQYVGELYGIMIKEDDPSQIGMVSPYYPNGTLLPYLKDRSIKDHTKMMIAIAKGIEYLHNQKIIHGDIKSTNILIDHEGNPRIIDFGLARAFDCTKPTGDTTTAINYSTFWAAPELIDGSLKDRTKKSDIYAFASTCLEIITGKRPYEHLKLKSTYQIGHRVVHEKKIPDRPSKEAKWAPSDELWELLERCWAFDASARPEMVDIKHKLFQLYRSNGF